MENEITEVDLGDFYKEVETAESTTLGFSASDGLGDEMHGLMQITVPRGDIMIVYFTAEQLRGLAAVAIDLAEGLEAETKANA